MHLLKQFKYTNDNVIHITKSRSLKQTKKKKFSQVIFHYNQQKLCDLKLNLMSSPVHVQPAV